jgi:hypothetical protein
MAFLRDIVDNLLKPRRMLVFLLHNSDELCRARTRDGFWIMEVVDDVCGSKIFLYTTASLAPRFNLAIISRGD